MQDEPTLFLLDFAVAPSGGASPLRPDAPAALAALRARGARAVVLDATVPEALRRLGVRPEAAAVVSDDPAGIGRGRRAGCRTIAATDGRGSRAELLAAGPDALLGAFAALPCVRPALAARLRAAIPPARFAHSLGVADEAWRLAVRYGADPDRAWLAGLLHDCAKGVPTAEQVAACDRLGVPLDPATRACPSVVHAFLGERLARDQYGVDDPAVLRAIRLHTVGDGEMTTLDKAVFLADAIEPGRDFPGVADLRAAAETGLDDALRLYVDGELRLLAARGGSVHPATLRLRDALARGAGGGARLAFPAEDG